MYVYILIFLAYPRKLATGYICVFQALNHHSGSIQINWRLFAGGKVFFDHSLFLVILWKPFQGSQIGQKHCKNNLLGGRTVMLADTVPWRGGFPAQNIGIYPIPSMYGIFTSIWLIFMVNVGKYTIHGCYGYWFSFSLGWICSCWNTPRGF